jgi:ABC-type branched-subunit amino acid transport system substrate-binding protein
VSEHDVEMGNRHPEMTRVETLGIGRRRLLKIGAAAGLLGVFGARSAEAEDDVNGPLTPWFGPGGPGSGAGLTWAHGLNLSLTGAGAPYGLVMSQGATIAANLIKASGGPDIVIKLNDHQNGDIQASVTGVRRMIEQEKIQSLGTSWGACSQALFPLVASSGVTTFWSGGANASAFGKKNFWITHALFAVDPCMGALACMAKKYPDAKRLAILGQLEDGMPAINDIAPKVWPQVSVGEVAMKEIVNIGTTDFGSIIAKLKAAKADLIFTTMFADDLGYLVKQVREANIEVPILCFDVAPSVPDIAGPAIAKNLYLAMDGYLPENANPYNRIFVEAHNKAYGKDPAYHTATFFEATNVLWATISRTIKAGKQPGLGNLSETIDREPEFPSVFGGGKDKAGVMTFEKDHGVIKPLGVYSVGLGGKLTTVASIVKNSTNVEFA